MIQGFSFLYDICTFLYISYA